MVESKDTPNDNGSGSSSNPVQDEWQKRSATWEQMAQAHGIINAADIDPSQIKMEVGPPMTAEQFEAWMAQRKNIMKKFSKQ